jgi:hypothetical protein
LKPYIDNEIHSRARRVKAVFSEKLRRASYTITNLAGPVLRLIFQNLLTFASPFTANDRLCCLSDTAWKKVAFSIKNCTKTQCKSESADCIFYLWGTVTSGVNLKNWLVESFFTGLTLILCSSPICF